MALKVLTLEGVKHLTDKIVDLLAGKVDKEDGKGLSTNDYTTAEKTKLAGIEASADANVIESVKVNGSALAVSDKSVNVDLSAYALKTDLTAVYRYKGNVATFDALPTEGMTVGDVYNVEEDGSNYAWNGEAWDDLAGVVDLTAYYTKEEADGKYVALTGAQTVAGVKTFTSNPVINGTWPTMSMYDTDDERGVAPVAWRRMGGTMIYDKNQDEVGRFDVQFSTAGTISSSMDALNTDAEGNTVQGSIKVHAKSDGTVATSAPTPSNASENSTAIATTAWVNLADSVVHTTGNETIAGAKTFTSNPIIEQTWPSITMKDTDYVKGSLPSSDHKVAWLKPVDSSDAELGGYEIIGDTKGNVYNRLKSQTLKSDGTEVKAFLYLYANRDGTAFATAPATRETGYLSNEIATCGWVETKIAAGGGEAITNDEIDSIFA